MVGICSSSCFGRLQVIMATMTIQFAMTYAGIIFNFFDVGTGILFHSKKTVYSCTSQRDQ
jgi:hypothetical protein